MNGPPAADRYGGTSPTPGAPIEGVPARRVQVDASEAVVNRDELRTVWRYFFLPNVALTGRDRILDGDDELELLGEPAPMVGRRSLHHVEALAAIVEG